MSYILDALRKSELERQNKQSVSLDDQILESVISQKSYQWLWITLGIMVVCILILSSIWLTLVITDPESSVPAHAPSAKVKTKSMEFASVEPEKFKVTQELPKSIPTEINSAAVIKEKDSQASIAEIIAARRAAQQSKKAPNPLPRPSKTSASLTKKQPAASIKTAKKFASPVPVLQPVKPPKRIIKQPVAKTKPVQQQQADVPLLKELSFEFRRSVPVLNINVFVYAEDPAKRFILVNMKKFTPGQQITEGMKLKEIRHDSLVVNYKNKTFRIKRP